MNSTQIISHQLSRFCVPDVDSVSPKHSALSLYVNSTQITGHQWTLASIYVNSTWITCQHGTPCSLNMNYTLTQGGLYIKERVCLLCTWTLHKWMDTVLCTWTLYKNVSSMDNFFVYVNSIQITCPHRLLLCMWTVHS